MRIPITINRNALKTYSDETIKGNEKSTLHSGNFLYWDKEIPKSLQEICVEAIAGNWEEKQILDEIPLTIDRCLLLDILSTRLPLRLTIPRIENDIYWKRCYLEKWPKSLPYNVPENLEAGDIVRVNNVSRRASTESINNTTKRKLCLKNQKQGQRRWKDAYLEISMRDYLEKLKPEEYDPEKIKELSDLCGDYVKILDIRELQCSGSSCSRIPLNSILTGFKNLTELSICFKQTYVGEAFRWDVLKISLQDIMLLGKGLEKCKLSVFRLRNSDINDEKLLLILKSLLKHDTLHSLDFSHCEISDYGCIYLSKFCQVSPVENLTLINNQIGSKGMEAICYAICKESCIVKSINFKLNPVGEKGANFLIKALDKGARNIKRVILSGCGLGKSNVRLGEMIENNSYLEDLDLSNNALGEELGEIILRGLKYNIMLNKIDVRMCQIHPKIEFQIQEKISKNRKLKTSLKFIKKPIIVEPSYDFDISEDLQIQIENAFESTNLR